MSKVIADGGSLATLTRALETPYAVVTLIDVAAARTTLARRGATELEAMLGVDDQGVADGVARGIWTVA